MMGKGMTPPAIRRIIELEQGLATVTRERDELARRWPRTVRPTAPDERGACAADRRAR